MTGEDGFRDWRGRLSRAAKRHFVNGKVALCRKESGDLSMVKWYFVVKSVVLIAKSVALCRQKCGTSTSRAESFGYPPHFGE